MLFLLKKYLLSFFESKGRASLAYLLDYKHKFRHINKKEKCSILCKHSIIVEDGRFIYEEWMHPI